MRHLTFSLLVAVSLAMGCSQQGGSGTNDSGSSSDSETNAAPGSTATGQEQSTSESQRGQNPLNAPTDYLGTIVNAKQSAEKTVNATSVNQAIQLFKAQEGRNPKTLQELVEEQYLPALPSLPSNMEYQYDPNSGTVKVLKK